MNVKEALLWPFSVLYGAGMHLRTRMYRMGILKQRRLQGVVISVGNLTVGGTGKTPTVIWIAEKLAAEGKSAALLTRGYGSRPAETVEGTGEIAPSELISDEVKVMIDHLGDGVSYGVGADRYARGLKLEKLGVNWFVLDDGFQHLELARDVDIVLIDSTLPFGGGHLLPAGRLREPRTSLSRADIIVITRSQHAPAIEAAIRRDSDAPIYYARPAFDSVRGTGCQRLDADDARRRKLFAFCGIGNPQPFIADLRGWGFQIAGHRFFPDHHRYSQQDAAEIERAAKAAGATGLICTEKDVFNFSGVKWNTCDLLVCRIKLEIDNGDDFWLSVVAKGELSAARRR